MDAYHQKNLGSIRPGVFAPHVGEIYTYTFLVLQLAYRRVR